MNFVKSSNGITVFGNDGKISMFPYGTFEFFCASQIENGEFENFPFLKSGKIYKDFEYDETSKLIIFKDVKLNKDISDGIKSCIWTKNMSQLELFYSFVEKATSKTLRWLNRFVKRDDFEKMAFSDAMCVTLEESEIARLYIQNSDFDPIYTGIDVQVIIKINEAGEIEVEGSAPIEYHFASEYSTVFNDWLKFIASSQRAKDVDEFYDSMNRKLNIRYSIKQFAINEISPLLSRILQTSVEIVENEEEEEYEEAF